MTTAYAPQLMAASLPCKGCNLKSTSGREAVAGGGTDKRSRLPLRLFPMQRLADKGTFGSALIGEL